MKMWFKYLLGIALGIVMAIVLPENNQQTQAVVDFLSEFVIRWGRYMLGPVVFFSVIMACYKLREERLILRTGALTFGLIIASTLLLTVLGMISALLIHLPHIPMTTIEKAGGIQKLDVRSLVMSIFPYTGFEALLHGAYLLPCFVFAGLLGAGASSEKSAAKASVTLFDSLSKICYNVMGFFTEVLAVGMIAVCCKFSFAFFTLKNTGLYMPLILLLCADLALVAFVIYPLLLRILCRGNTGKPFRVLYASFCPFLTAFFSGDANVTLAVAMRHGKESLGIKRRVNAVTYPLFSVFARGGSALVMAIGFIVILRSYSLLEISVRDILWIGGVSFLLSFVLANYPSGGAFFAITVLCASYSPNFEAGYLLLRDAAPILCAFASAFDVLTVMFGSYIVAVRTNTLEPQELKHFI